MSKEVICPGCGKVFTNPKSFSGHCHGCKGYHGQRKRVIKSIIMYDELGTVYYKCPGCNYTSYNSRSMPPHMNKCKGCLSEDDYNKMLDLQKEYSRRNKPGRSKAFAEGRLIPTRGSKFKSSYFKDNHFRSSYEAIYAAWLLSNNIEFEYETISLEYADNSSIYIPDFYIPKYNKLVEIKGAYDKYKISISEELSLVNSYNYELILGDNIWIYYNDLNERGFNIDYLYSKLMESDINSRIHWDFVDNKFIIL